MPTRKKKSKSKKARKSVKKSNHKMVLHQIFLILEKVRFMKYRDFINVIKITKLNVRNKVFSINYGPEVWLKSY